MEHDETEQIKSLLDGGYVDAARHRLEEILKADQHDMGAWLLYVNSFKTIDTRLEVLEICRRLNPDNLKVKSAIAALKMKKSADAGLSRPPPGAAFQGERARPRRGAGALVIRPCIRFIRAAGDSGRINTRLGI